MSGPSVAIVERPLVTLSKISAPRLQKCSSERSSLSHTACGYDKKRRTVQRAGAGPAPASVPSIIHDVLRSPGRPLESSTRAFAESRLGQDFSNVRIHTDAQAAESARAANAYAYTVGRDVIFGGGRYAPETAEGRRLLVHELAHTVQQAGFQRAAEDRIDGMSEPRDPLEAEADRVASQSATGGHRVALSLVRAPTIARTEAAEESPVRDWEPLDPHDHLQSLGIDARALPSDHPDTVAFRVREFQLPRKKGHVLDAWQRHAHEGSLQSTIDFTGESPLVGLWQGRDPQPQLINSWLRKVHWTRDNASENWQRAGGDPSGPGRFLPRLRQKTCQMDHIVELQLHGSNIDENVQVLDEDANRESGTQIWSWVSGLARQARLSVNDRKISRVTLQFMEVVEVGEGTACPAVEPEPGHPAESCCQIEQAAKRRAASTPAPAPSRAELERYDISAGGSSSTIEARPSPQTTELLGADRTPANRNASQIIPGLLLKELHRRAGRDKIEASVDTERLGRPRLTRSPLISLVRDPSVTLNVATDTHRLSLAQRDLRDIRFLYPYLSHGTLHMHLDPEGNLIGTGKLTPEAPLPFHTRFNLTLTRESLRASMDARPASLRTPIPGLRLSQADIGIDILPEFRPSGTVAFEVGPRGQRLLTGNLELSADPSGGVLGEGKLYAHLPHIDEASADLHYRNGAWSAEIPLRSSQIHLPGVREGELRVAFDNEGPHYSGSVRLAIPPAEQVIDLGIRRGPGGSVLYTGRGTFELPRLRPVEVNVSYDGEHFTGSARAGVNIRNVTGNVAVHYRDGRFSGESTVNLAAGRGHGTATVRLSPSGRLSGVGSVTYPFTRDLVGTLGVEVPEQGPVHVVGGITVPRPIEVFPRFPRGEGRHELFRAPQIDIPIVGISVGPISAGLIARIEFSVGATYGIGPGTLRNVRITTAFNPFEERPNFEMEGGLVFDIPAHAGLYASVRGALGLSAGVASVTGGITVTGEARLEGGFRGDMALHYREGQFALNALASIRMGPRFILGLDADITAKVGVWGLSASKTWMWQLASFEWRPPLEFGLEAPIRFASNEPFTFPSFDQIRWIRPNLDVHALLSSMMGRSGRREG